MRMFRLLLSAAICILLPAGVFATELLVNGSFEDGLNGWDFVSDNTSAIPVAWGGVTTTDGGSMAVLGPGFLGVSMEDALLGQTVNIAGYDEVTISFDWALEQWDFSLNGDDAVEADETNVDFLGLIVSSPGVPDYLDAWVINAADGFSETIGWLHESVTLTGLVSDTLFIGFQLYNGGLLDLYLWGQEPGDFSADTTAFLDNVSIQSAAAPVPEPSTMLLLGSGLVGIFFMGRKMRVRSAAVKE